MIYIYCKKFSGLDLFNLDIILSHEATTFLKFERKFLFTYAFLFICCRFQSNEMKILWSYIYKIRNTTIKGID